ncbi:protein DEK isoform X2 [Gouania willdenowi]|uniref:DEK-C domain-containing protein n=1 Tax=Gouania willdenowi TaxID=441366 RepID=A0A8C5GA95_GOUWI|nr:protein DEK isoform X2 [Gouania willdenowi]
MPEEEESVMSIQSCPTSSGDVVEGKRAKKSVERFDLQAPKQKEKLKMGDGSGEKLGDIPRTNFHISRMKVVDLKALHTILFDRPGKATSIKKNLRLFNGFSFDGDSEQFTKKRNKLLKSSNFTNTKLKAVCNVLDLEKKGTHSDLVDRILTFLLSPKNSGKRLPVKKKRKSKKKLSGDDSTLRMKKKKKNKVKSSSVSPKKSKSSSKSNAIVMDSSSDDEEEEEVEDKRGASAHTDRQASTEDQSESEEEEAVTSKPASRKTQKTPMKKRARRDSSEEDEEDSEEVEEPKKKKSAPNKPAAKSKKADSSSNTHTGEVSSDEDEPLIRMVKKVPSDDQLKLTVQTLLKEADLEQMTMKQICQRVFDTYPDYDLSSRKDFIKHTVKSLIT